MAKGKTKKNTRRGRAQKPATKPVVAVIPEVTQPTGKSAPVIEKKWWQRTPRSERPQYHRLPNVIQLTKSAYRLLSLNWKLFVGIALWYGVLNLLLVRGLNGGANVAELKAQFSQPNGLTAGIGVFSQLVSSSNSSTASDAASVYQFFLVLIISLALVWSFRQLLSDKVQRLRIRDGFYQGMYPLVPVMVVLLIISLQLLPMLIGGVLFGIIISNGIAVTALEVSVCVVIFLALCLWSLIWITPSIVALYIVSLPQKTPLQALRAAKKLVRFRRLTVLRKLLFLPLLILVALAAIIIPTIFVVPVLAQWVYLLLSLAVLPVVHAYSYTLYRELLNE